MNIIWRALWQQWSDVQVERRAE